MQFPRTDLPAEKKNISYFNLGSFRNFSCRGVLIDDKPNCEYHIKLLRPDLKLSYLYAVILGAIENVSLEIADPDKTLNLEYPMFMKVESILSNEIIEDSLREVDNILG